MVDYDIIKKESVKEYPINQVFYINPQFLRLPEIKHDYISESFGRKQNDIVLPAQHAVGLLRKVLKFDDKVIQLAPEYKQQLVEDFKNYLKCLSINPMETEYTKMFMEALFYVGIFSEVFDSISNYYSENHYNESRREESAVPLNYTDFYRNVGDYLLFVKKDYTNAQKAFSLLGINWSDVLKGQKLYPDETANYWSRESSLYADILAGERITRIAADYDATKQNIISLYNKLDKYETSDSYPSLVEICDGIIKLVNSTTNIGQKRLGFYVIESIRRHYCIRILYQYQIDSDKRLSKIVATEDIIWFAGYLPKKISDYVSSMDNVNLDGQILSLVGIVHSASLIQNELRVKDHFDGTAYYTSFNTFSLMLPYKCIGSRSKECGKLAVMHVSYMNDPTEGQILKELVFRNPDNIVNESERSNANVPYVFIKCFTGLPDYLPMWNMYGDSAKGVSLVMDWGADSNKLLYRVCYVTSRKTINKTDNPGIDVGRINDQIKHIKRQIRKNKSSQFIKLAYTILDSICFLFKSSSYSYEKEMRILYQYDSFSDSFIHAEKDGNVLMYVNPDMIIPIKEIILGPKFENAAMKIPFLQEQLDRMSEITNSKAIKISLSNIDYR